MNLPKFPRQFIRKEDEPGYQPETWQPKWHCFCCHDTGKINPHLAKLVIEEYDLSKDKIPRCQNPSCKAGDNLDFLGSQVVDYRFTAAICQHLDSIHREEWRQTTETKTALVQEKIAQLAQQKSLKKPARTPSEETEIQEKYAAIVDEYNKKP
ncbi:hypothetical protein [Coleofasciculus sp.]|uniref:hypothetical protein n=1 Tax=Coleofasciculus sp. TaxID=3100458 RepID=UPI0039F9A9D9